MLSASNYLVSVNEILQSERKLKVKNLLKLYTSSKGVINIKDFLVEFCDTSMRQGDAEFVKSFLSMICPLRRTVSGIAIYCRIC